MLENKLYLIEHKEVIKGIVTYTIRQNKNNKIFKAHFPENPIMPGACLVEIAKDLCEKHLNKHLNIKKIKSVKFINVVTPITNEFLQFQITFSPKNEESTQAKVLILSERNVYSKINFELA